jgi:cell wall-associated NlpC family hydrolase
MLGKNPGACFGKRKKEKPAKKVGKPAPGKPKKANATKKPKLSKKPKPGKKASKPAAPKSKPKKSQPTPPKNPSHPKPAPPKRGSAFGAGAVSRAHEWVAAKLQYCQAPYGARDYDSACSPYCRRQSHSAWNPYRSDCSGLVSWAWKLPAPGHTTRMFAPFDHSVTHVIQASELQPGDAVNNSEHVMLFVKWVVHGKKAVLYEEPGCSASPPHARETVASVSIHGSTIHVPGHSPFTAIRYKNA